MVRPATPADVPLLLRGILELARYEKLEHELDMDGLRLEHALFAPSASVFAFVAEEDGHAVGFALGFTTFSTFKTKLCVHLEDLFVFEPHRGKGHGLRLLRAVAAEACRRGASRLQWNVLDWNTPAIEFYEAQGASLLRDWRICRVEGDALASMASAS